MQPNIEKSLIAINYLHIKRFCCNNFCFYFCFLSRDKYFELFRPTHLSRLKRRQQGISLLATLYFAIKIATEL
nr:hypothetical protein BCU55_03750 [Shewanella sp. 10N.286.48.A6]